MGIFFGIAMVGGVIVGLGIVLVLGSIDFVIMRRVNRRIYARQFFNSMFTIIPLLLVLGMIFYPYEYVRPGGNYDYDITTKNFFIGGLGYSASIGIAALFAAIVAFLYPLSLCPKKPLTEIVPKSDSVNIISKILIVYSSFGMLDSSREIFTSSRTFESLPYLFLIFLIWLILFIPSLGLLKRQNWARISIQVLLVIVILWKLKVFILEFPRMIKSSDIPMMILVFLSASIILVPKSKEIKSEFVDRGTPSRKGTIK